MYEALRQVVVERHLAEKSNSSDGGAPEGERPQLFNLDFRRVAFVLLDERYVHPTDPKSNVRLVMEKLFGYRVNPDAKASASGSSEGKLFVPGDHPWPSEIEFYFPNTSLPLEECVEDYRQVRRLLSPTSRRPSAAREKLSSFGL